MIPSFERFSPSAWLDDCLTRHVPIDRKPATKSSVASNGKTIIWAVVSLGALMLAPESSAVATPATPYVWDASRSGESDTAREAVRDFWKSAMLQVQGWPQIVDDPLDYPDPIA